MSAIEAITLLSQLGDLAQSSLSAIATAPVAAPADVPQKQPDAPLENPKVRYVSEKPEYQAALSNEELIQALLQLSGNARPRPVTERQDAAPPEQPAPQAPLEPGFSPFAAPEVAASPKPSPFFKRSPGQTQTILR